MNRKYIVFKRDEFRRWAEVGAFGNPSDLAGLTPIAIEDAVVIRRQDVFAPPALDAYANAISVVIESLIMARNDTTKEPGYLVPEFERPRLQATIDKLQSIADYFHDEARIAWDTVRKLPD